MSIFSSFGLVSTKNFKLLSLFPNRILQSFLSSTSGFIITDSNDLYKVDILSSEKFFLCASIVQVSSNGCVAAFVTSTGNVLTIGEDLRKYGLLGERNCYYSSIPVKVPIDSVVKSVHIGTTHAAALNESGEIFTWGSGFQGELGNNLYCEKQLPSLVQSGKIFLIKQVVCGNGFTAICTSGGFLYIYGQLTEAPCGQYREKLPFSVPKLNKYFIARVDVCDSFLVAMSDLREVFLIDSCLEPVKLPGCYSKIACSFDSLIAISKKNKLVHEFKSSAKGFCKASSLVERVFVVEELFVDKISLFSGTQVGYLVRSVKSDRLDLNLQYLRQNLYKVPDDVKNSVFSKSALVNFVSLLTKKNKVLVLNSLACIKCFARCLDLKEKSTISLVLLSIINNFSMRLLICKKKALSNFLFNSENKKKKEKNLVYKKTRSLEKVLISLIRKVFSATLNIFQDFEQGKIKKIRYAEKIFAGFSMKINKDLKKGLFVFRKNLGEKKKMTECLDSLFSVAAGRLKINFFHSLLDISVIKTKMCIIINQILAYSLAKGSRSQLFKYFNEWKRQNTSMKIAKISEKYAKSMKIKKISEKLKQAIRKTVKIGFFGIKHYILQKPSKLQINFLVTSFKRFFIFPKKLAFSSLKINYKKSKKLVQFIKGLCKKKSSLVLNSIFTYILTKKKLLLMKILMKLQTKESNLRHRVLFKYFSGFKKGLRRRGSPVQSLGSDSQGRASPTNPSPRTRPTSNNISPLYNKPKPVTKSPKLTLQTFLKQVKSPKAKTHNPKTNLEIRAKSKAMTCIKKNPNKITSIFEDFFFTETPHHN